MLLPVICHVLPKCRRSWHSPTSFLPALRNFETLWFVFVVVLSPGIFSLLLRKISCSLTFENHHLIFHRFSVLHFMSFVQTFPRYLYICICLISVISICSTHLGIFLLLANTRCIFSIAFSFIVETQILSFWKMLKKKIQLFFWCFSFLQNS